MLGEIKTYYEMLGPVRLVRSC